MVLNIYIRKSLKSMVRVPNLRRNKKIKNYSKWEETKQSDKGRIQ